MAENIQAPKKVWLTYSWKDNEESQVNWIVQELERFGLEIHLDNRDLAPGKRLWDQIARAISDPNQCDSWIFFVTPNSLASQPCQEELAYALNRALDNRGSGFPLIGLVDGRFDEKNLPLALKVRLCVTTGDAKWRERVVAGVNGMGPGGFPGDEIAPVITQLHPYEKKGAKYCLEIRPRVGSWRPFMAGVRNEEKTVLMEVRPGSRGQVPEAFFAIAMEGKNDTHIFKGINNEITPTTSAYVVLRELPTELVFGEAADSLPAMGERFRSIPIQYIWRPNSGH